MLAGYTLNAVYSVECRLKRPRWAVDATRLPGVGLVSACAATGTGLSRMVCAWLADRFALHGARISCLTHGTGFARALSALVLVGAG